MADIFPADLHVAWEPLPEDEAPSVEAVVELAVRLEDRLRKGEKVCHDARDSLKGQPQISCPQTIAQVQCVREVLLQQSSIYTDLVMRADLPASKRGVQVCISIRGEGPPSLRPSERVADETQADRYKREREHRLQIDTIQDDHQPDLLKASLLPPPASEDHLNTLPSTQVPHDNSFDANGTRKCAPGGPKLGVLTKATTRRNSSGRTDLPGGRGVLLPRKLVTLGSYSGNFSDLSGEGSNGLTMLSPTLLGKDSSLRQPLAQDRARVVGLVPYPTMRSLRKS
ncbi:unnamed protein product [Ectocarpus sp. CCAP 1310/34]|nr:unnamed protein product [Ectocarpus sp. CCAP 1310/34]